jgi:hypothetical protein
VSRSESRAGVARHSATGETCSAVTDALSATERHPAASAADHGSPIPHVDDWAALADAIHAVIEDELGDCPDNQVQDGGLCHDIAETLINLGWSR